MIIPLAIIVCFIYSYGQLPGWITAIVSAFHYEGVGLTPFQSDFGNQQIVEVPSDSPGRLSSYDGVTSFASSWTNPRIERRFTCKRKEL